jgi:predicted nucleic acid-binding protein
LPVEAEDVEFARSLIDRYPALAAPDLLHLACCTRRGVTAVKTFDRALDSAFR